MQKIKTITLAQLDKTPVGEIITYPAKELFEIQKKARQDFEKSLMRRKWIEGVIELKYKIIINDLVSNAEETLKANQQEFENDNRNKSADNPNQKPNQFKDDLFNLHNKHSEYIQDGEDCIKVEFYKGLSDIFQRPTIKTRFTLVENKATAEV